MSLVELQIDENTKHRRQSKSKDLREALVNRSSSVLGRSIFIVRLPSANDHDGHYMGSVLVMFYDDFFVIYVII